MKYCSGPLKGKSLGAILHFISLIFRTHMPKGTLSHDNYMLFNRIYVVSHLSYAQQLIRHDHLLNTEPLHLQHKRSCKDFSRLIPPNHPIRAVMPQRLETQRVIKDAQPYANVSNFAHLGICYIPLIFSQYNDSTHLFHHLSDMRSDRPFVLIDVSDPFLNLSHQ